jgi:hypothetical protein
MQGKTTNKAQAAERENCTSVGFGCAFGATYGFDKNERRSK